MQRDKSTADDAVSVLGKRLGVASHYLDQGDARVEIARDTQLALMESLGFPAATPSQVEESTARLDQQTAGLLPPWVVIDAGAPHRLDLPKNAKATRWRLTGEAGYTAEQNAQSRIEIPALEAGYYHLELDGQATRTLLIVAPRTCWTPASFMRDEARGWGVTAQVYGLRSERNEGFGDFTDVANLAKAAGRHGASFLGLSPLHALFTSDRSKISPYSPSSRLFVEPLYLDAARVGGDGATDALRAQIERLRAAPLVDYREAWDVKRKLLEAAYKKHRDASMNSALAKRAADLGEALQSHATFEALSEHFTQQGQVWAGVWPEEYQDASSAAVARFRRDHADRIAFHAWLQALCDEQLEQAARETGMEIGLYRDLAVGADRFGSEVWASPDRYALTLSVGAPPDPLGPQGQNWGFPPFNPVTLQTQDFAAFRDLVVANMRHAGAIRIDHAFQLQRLFLVPPGATAAHGGYVEFPLEALLAILRLESQRHRCMVIAEDLGTGPKGFSDKIMRSGLLSYRILSFERTKDGGFVAPGDYPRDALAAITTHDLPTFKGWRRGFDIDLRSHFGVFSEAQARSEQQGRLKDVEHWRDALRREGLTGDLEDDAASRNDALSYLARTPSILLAVQIEDMLDEINQANLPGLSEGPPNWRRRMSESVEAFTRSQGALGKTGALMAAEGRTLRARESRLAGAPPRATYRLQFHAGFTFDMAREILPYLKKLGISHVYASPIQKARKGSTHGYDVVDPREINPELGGRVAFDAFSRELHALGLKLIIDIVPNHMGIGAENPFWTSVLRWGERSPYARVFDIDFRRGGGKVLLPVLGQPYAQALEAGEFSLAFDAQRGFVLRYFDRGFPVAPQCYAKLSPQLADKDLLAPETFDAALQRLAKAASDDEVQAICERVSKDTGALDALMRKQNFRLAHWRLAGSEINYRRFFEINALAGVRVEDEHVFELTHELIFDLVENGQVDGLRIDHVDGLADPQAYLHALQRRVGPGFYIVVEKILERGERLKDWPIAGSTGYEALNELDGVLVAREAQGVLDTFYREHVGQSADYETALENAKRLVLERSFGAECDHIADALFKLARSEPRTMDVSHASLRRVLQQAVVALPVYRTYVGAQGPDEADRKLIDETMEKVRAHADPADAVAVDFVQAVLCADVAAPESAGVRRSFEQLTGPVMAKGLEDTLFYRHAPFLALNEVGADPSCFGYAKEAFDESVATRARDWPANLIATATHDTKRGEDSRARLFAATAAPELFLADADMFLARVPGPDRNDAFILFQALVAAWPLDGSPPKDFAERARGFFQKALREAKRHSSWTDPDEDYETKALGLVDACVKDGPLREIVAGAAQRLAFPGALNGLARTILKLTLPGVPDFYQGTEWWDFAFVDPDNRRPVDFTSRAGQLERFRELRPADLLESWRDGRIKQWLIARLLAERAADPDLFAYGDYTSSDWAAGVSFQRRHDGRELFVCVPTGTQLLQRDVLDVDRPVVASSIWSEKKLTLKPGRWRNLLTGSAFAVEGAMACDDVADGLPWLILGTQHE
jgi:(1->4)-alpha-D-glucan 1-alpha-D-glucosylmutase